ncbi:hypothetical protein O0L34_g16530 [Tuta absoluta]|nr:hypothetical protein O0L34_g16530 [Tuta absoluta]
MDYSPPARACMMACDIFNVPVEMVDINITAQKHKTPEFLKLNPLHTVPVFKDEDLVIQDSHAILMYLSDVYAADDCWYPRDLKWRALVNQKLFFDTSFTSPIVKTVIVTMKLYKMDPSPPARTAMMACGIFNVPVEMIDVQLLQGDNKKPEYLKKNPTHTVPVLEDGDLIVNDSHAIIQYLADAYGKDDSWYPKDAKKRARINQKLFFDTGILFPRLRNVTYSAIFEGDRNPPQKKLDDIKETYGFLEEFLKRSKFLAGDTLTIADVPAFATVTSLAHIVSIPPQTYPKINSWLEEIKKQPFAQKYNEPGEKAFGEIVKAYLDL